MTVHEHHLLGCHPEPLGSYLKALGILRLVGEQADAAATGWWRGDRLVIATDLDSAELSEFFLDCYVPTPVLSPWNSSSGFGPEGRGELQDIESSDDPRLFLYREAIAAARRILRHADEQNWTKEEIMACCRSWLPDECLPWLDASVVLTPEGAAYPPLLGTGGNIGRFEVSRNFHNRVLEVLGVHVKKGYDPRAWLTDALYGSSDSSGLRGESPSQFDPGSAGGANSSPDAPDGRAAAVLNPWDFVLLVEGAVLFAAGVSRRLAAGANSRAAAPFSAGAVAAGYASAAEDEPSKGEVWAPLWARPSTLSELTRLLAEGRADWRSRHARSGLDLARAAASLGVDRGVSAFARYVFLERAGQAAVAVPAGRVVVAERPAVAPLADLDSWLDRVRRGSDPPATVKAARRSVDQAVFEAAARGDTEALLAVLVEVARLEDAIGKATSFRGRAGLEPLQGLRASRWAPLLLEAMATPELRVALALSSSRDLNEMRTRTRRSLRTLLRPMNYDRNGRLQWAQSAPVEGFGVRPVTEILAEAHCRRVIDLLAERRRSGEAVAGTGLSTGFDRALWAPVADVAALAHGELDEELLGRLLSACLLLDWDRVDVSLGGRQTGAVPTVLSILGPFYSDQKSRPSNSPNGEWSDVLEGAVLESEPSWPAMLSADRIEHVVTAALRRLRIAGLAPVITDGSHVAAGLEAGDGPKLGAALLCAMSPSARMTFLRQSCPDPYPQEERRHAHA
jgi:CRISPR-associated protein Csx17